MNQENEKPTDWTYEYLCMWFAMLTLMSANVFAQSEVEREVLTRIVDELHVLKTIVRQAEKANKTDTTAYRYTFDYEALQRDIAAIETGLTAYLNPTRAMPMVPPPFRGDYVDDAHKARE